MTRPGLRNGPLHGRVKKIFYQDGYGFLESEDGRDIYFHENSLIKGKFSRLETGMEVTYSEEEGEKGPQASSLKRIGKNGYHVFPQIKPSTKKEFIMRKPTSGIEHSLVSETAAPRAAGGQLLTFLLGVAAGGVITYLLDPQDGARRRSLIGDKLFSWQNDAVKYSGKLGRHLSNKATGIAAQARSAMGKPATSSGVETPEAEMH